MNASGLLNDTWVYDPVATTWTQITTAAPTIGNSPVYAKMSYDSDHNVFVMAQVVGGGYYGGYWTAYSVETWLFRYAGAGANAGTQPVSATPGSGGLNRFNAGWAKDPALATDGTSLYVAWSEESSPFTQLDDAWPHIYVSHFSGGSWSPLGTAFTSISFDTFEAHLPSLAVVNGVPWVSYYQGSNTGQTAKVYSSSWDGASNWIGGALGVVSTKGFQGQSQVIGVGGAPHVALLEVDETVYPQRTMVRVWAQTGSGWSQKGSALNQKTVTGDTALSVSIASDGVNPLAAWSEYVHTENGNGYDYDSNPQIFVSQWNGSQWVPLGSALNIDPANGWAYDPSIAYVNGAPYVAWVERTQAGNNQLYVKTWNGTAWVLVGPGALNQAPVAGWAYHPNLVADANTNSLYLGWVEQTALGQKAQVFVSLYRGGSWSNLGGSLNVDPVQGSAQRVSLGVFNGQPVAAWGEVNLGSTRQVFVKQWSGSTWTQLPGPPVPDTTAPLSPNVITATAISTTQINLQWNAPKNNSDTDDVGILGYYVKRNGVLVATVTSTLSYQDTGLTANTTYAYTVSGYDAAGNVSAPANGTGTTMPGPAVVSAVSLAATSVSGGASVSATVVLTSPAPAGGAAVTLISDNPVATVPATVTVAAGNTTSPAFTITTTAVTAAINADISATYGGITVSATLTVNPPAAPSASAVTLSPGLVIGGNPTTRNTVTLSAPAPAGGAVVTLGSNSGLAAVPPTVTVAAGTTVSPAFTITTNAVATNMNVTISATYSGTTASAVLTLAPATGSTFFLRGNASEVSGTVVTPTVGPAGFSGQVINNGGSTNFVPPGDGVWFGNCCGYTGNAYYQFAGTPVASIFGASQGQISFNLTSRYSFANRDTNAQAQRNVFDVVDGQGTHLFDFAVQVGNGNPDYLLFSYMAARSGTLYFVTPGTEDALFGNGVVLQVTITWGQTGSALFLNGNQVATAAPANQGANSNQLSTFDLGGYNYLGSGYNSCDDIIAEFTVAPPAVAPTLSLSAVTLTTTSVVGGNTLAGNTVTLSAAAPASGAVVTLSSNNASATLPASVTVPGGQTVSQGFAITTTAVTAVTTVGISASYGSSTANTTLTVNPPGATSPSVTAVTLSPAAIVGGNQTTQNTVALGAPAPVGGAMVTLSSNNVGVTVPSSVTVAAGATVSPAFTITTAAVTVATPVTISATYGGVTANTMLTVNPPGGASSTVTVVTLSPASIVGGNSTTQNTVTLSAPAAAGGAVVTLSSNNASVTVPGSVTVTAGAAVSPVFTINTTAVTAATSVTISASFGGATANAILTVSPAGGASPTVTAVTLSPASIVRGKSDYPKHRDVERTGAGGRSGGHAQQQQSQRNGARFGDSGGGSHDFAGLHHQHYRRNGRHHGDDFGDLRRGHFICNT